MRRVPWKVLIDHSSPPLPHIGLLASQRRTHLLEAGDLPFSCVALIRPQRYPMSAEIPGGVLAACDLDGTLIYSHSAIQATQHSAALVCVEHYRDQPSPYLTAHAARQTEELAHIAVLVPATTRTPHQYARRAAEVRGLQQRRLTVRVAEEMFVYLVTRCS